MNARKRATKIDLTVNKLDRETFDTLSAEQISPKELWFITSADSVVVDIDKIGSGGGHDYGPEISELSADKRDYDDLTVQKEMDMPPYYNVLNFVDSWGYGSKTFSQFMLGADGAWMWYDSNPSQENV